MIHTVYMPEQDKALLLDIVALQTLILELATERDSPFSDDGQEISACLEELSDYQENATAITKWIARKSKFFDNLQKYAQHPGIDAKRDLRSKIQADIELLLTPTSQPLQATLPLRKLPRDSWQYGIGGFFSAFYDEWSGTGFQPYLFRRGTTVKRKFTRRDFVRHFIEANPDLYICPICDASAYRNETSSGTYTSIDHFFPRSKYPHLSIHPYNLLPMCSACNSGEAGQNDPHDGLEGISELVLPYHHKGLVGRTYIKVDFRPFSEAGKREDWGLPLTHALTFSLETATGEPEELKGLIEHFNNVYGMQTRWNKGNNLTLIDEHVFRRVRQFLLSDIERGEPLHDPQFLLERLELLMGMIDEQSLGQDPFSYMMTWWLMYHVSRLEQQKEKIKELAEDSIDCATYQMSEGIEPIFAELYCWAQEQQEAFAALKERAKQLRARMPRAL